MIRYSVSELEKYTGYTIKPVHRIYRKNTHIYLKTYALSKR